ncbi:MAG: hypothetical protein HUJ26_19515 [Planctomycetaceae bacterium]|nr:hypothetical protein [Planctomycetaceae bacterium]
MARQKRQGASPESEATPSNVHRVYPLPEETIERMRTARDRAESTNRTWLLEATAARLPGLVDSLRALGFGTAETPKKNARLPLDPETLEALQAASQTTGLPQTLLLQLVIDAHATEQAPKRKRRTGKRKGAK